MKKTISLILTVLLFVSMLSFGAYAAEPEDTPNPCYIALANCSASIDMSSAGLATCCAGALTYNGYYVEAEMTLEKLGSNGWEIVKSWYDYGNNGVNMEESRYVTHGYYYRTVAYFDIFTTAGRFVETTSIASGSEYY